MSNRLHAKAYEHVHGDSGCALAALAADTTHERRRSSRQQISSSADWMLIQKEEAMEQWQH